MRDAAGAKAERGGIRIARLPLKARPVDGAPVEPRRRPGLEPASAQPQLLERFAQQNGRRLSRTPRRILLLPAVNQPVEKSPGSDDDRVAETRRPSRRRMPRMMRSLAVPCWSHAVGSTSCFASLTIRSSRNQRTHRNPRTTNGYRPNDSTITSATSACLIFRFACDSSTSRIFRR
jgi:hypothetical protein